MRIIKAFITSLLIIAIVCGTIFFTAREVLLVMTTSKIKQSLVLIRDVQQEQMYATECMSKGSSRDTSGNIHYTQLRFIDLNSFVVEVICNGMEHSPIELAAVDLPPLVYHEVGQSGLRWSEDAGLNFTCLNRVGSISVIDGMVYTSLKPTQTASTQGPPSQSESYGYECCDVDFQQGDGKAITAALDCPQTCYASCLDRPLILSFSTQPYYDKLTRTLQVNRGQSVIFSYTVSPNQEVSFNGFYDESDQIEKTIAMIEMVFNPPQPEDEVEVIIDFGDGQQEEFSSLRGQVEHQYDCAIDICLYTAKLKVIKQNGIESLDSLQNTIKVQVN